MLAHIEREITKFQFSPFSAFFKLLPKYKYKYKYNKQVYADLMSQPARSVVIFCRAAGVPHEHVGVSFAPQICGKCEICEFCSSNIWHLESRGLARAWVSFLKYVASWVLGSRTNMSFTLKYVASWWLCRWGSLQETPRLRSTRGWTHCARCSYNNHYSLLQWVRRLGGHCIVVTQTKYFSANGERWAYSAQCAVCWIEIPPGC